MMSMITIMMTMIMKMMMLTASMKKDRIGWFNKSSLGPRGAKTPPSLSSQMASQNQMVMMKMFTIIVMLIQYDDPHYDDSDKSDDDNDEGVTFFCWMHCLKKRK